MNNLANKWHEKSSQLLSTPVNSPEKKKARNGNAEPEKINFAQKQQINAKLASLPEFNEKTNVGSFVKACKDIYMTLPPNLLSECEYSQFVIDKVKSAAASALISASKDSTGNITASRIYDVLQDRFGRGSSVRLAGSQISELKQHASEPLVDFAIRIRTEADKLYTIWGDKIDSKTITDCQKFAFEHGVQEKDKQTVLEVVRLGLHNGSADWEDYERFLMEILLKNPQKQVVVNKQSQPQQRGQGGMHSSWRQNSQMQFQQGIQSAICKRLNKNPPECTGATCPRGFRHEKFTKPCRLFQEGTCSFGDKCMFPHVESSSSFHRHPK